MIQQEIHVAAGAIEDTRGRILVTRRPNHVHQGGLWEFPGGKLESGETPEQGLRRELEEELGVLVLGSRPLIRIRHDYGDRSVLLDVHSVSTIRGEPHGREGQPLVWQHPDEMNPTEFPAADRPVIKALRLPRLYLITGADPREPRSFLMRLAAAIEGGIHLVQLRAHGLSGRHFASLSRRAFDLCESQGARLLLNTDAPRARDLPCHGLHLTSRRLLALDRRPMDDDRWVGASCHSSLDLRHAAQLGLDYALLSPVKLTVSHPAANPLGWGRFAALAEDAMLPVYALGGLVPADLEEAARRGAQGIAAIHGLWPQLGRSGVPSPDQPRNGS